MIIPSEQTPQTIQRSNGLRLAIIAGLLFWLAFPPFNIWPLAWAALTPLFISISRARNGRQAMWRGYVFGWCFLVPLWYWTGLTIVYWTGSIIGWLALIGLTLLMAGFYALWAGVAWRLMKRLSGVSRVAALAASWVILEWTRTLGTLSMPWGQISMSQTHNLPILQIADIGGAYSISFFVILLNASLGNWWLNRTSENSARSVWLSAIAIVMASLYGLARIGQPDGSQRVRIANMQCNFDVHETIAAIPRELQVITSMSRAASQASPPPELYIWSESAAPGDAFAYPPTREALSMLAASLQSPMVYGSRTGETVSRVEYNSSVLFEANGRSIQRYNKRQLVPFGEFIPYRNWIPPAVMNAFQMDFGDVTPGSGPALLHCQNFARDEIKLGPFICFESAFPKYAREETLAGANLLLNQSNDSWFHSKAALEQHLALVCLRAVENRRCIVRSTTSGISCFIDSSGRIHQQIPLNQAGFAVRSVDLRDGITLYTRFGDWFVGACFLIIIVILWKSRSISAEEIKP